MEAPARQCSTTCYLYIHFYFGQETVTVGYCYVILVLCPFSFVVIYSPLLAL